MYIPKLNSYFIHIPKCGGTSIELFFFKLHGFNIKEQNIYSQLGQKGHQFHWGGKFPERLPTGETQHLSARLLKKWNNPQFMNSTYKFTIVRNPYDRFISELKWRRNLNQRNSSFSYQNLLKVMEDHKTGVPFFPHDLAQHKFVYDEQDNLLVDDVFKLEEIDKAKKKLSEVFGMEVDFGHFNKTASTSYKQELTQDILSRLNPLIEKDLEVFGYTY